MVCAAWLSEDVPEAYDALEVFDVFEMFDEQTVSRTAAAIIVISIVFFIYIAPCGKFPVHYYSTPGAIGQYRPSVIQTAGTRKGCIFLLKNIFPP